MLIKIDEVEVKQKLDYMPFDKDGKHATGYSVTTMYVYKDQNGKGFLYGKDAHGTLIPFTDPMVRWELEYEE